MGAMREPANPGLEYCHIVVFSVKYRTSAPQPHQIKPSSDACVAASVLLPVQNNFTALLRYICHNIM